MTVEKQILPFGLWPSSVSAGMVSGRLRLDDVQWSGDGRMLIWAEGRSDSTVLTAAALGSSARFDLTDEQSPRGGVGYGGGAFTTAQAGSHGFLVFANRDGRLYRRSLDYAIPSPITPSIGASGAVASPAVSPDGRWVIYVYSDGKTDLLSLVDAEGKNWPVQFARGADFFMQPSWHPQGDRLAWIEWDHPNMPWDGTRVMLAQVSTGSAGTQLQLENVSEVGGGPEQAAQQPLFSPDGHWLSFIEEKGEWPNLVLIDLQSGQRRELINGDGFELSVPAWVQGVRSYGWSSDSQRIFYIRYQGPNASLWVVDVMRGDTHPIDTSPFTWLSQLAVSPTADNLVLIGSAPDQPDQIVLWRESCLEPVAYSTPATYDPNTLPDAREISWKADNAQTTYGLYYAPLNPAYAGHGLPPAILHIHGGPTSIAPNSFNPRAAYFTSRGYAYTEVNYRGSTGYGRTYRNALRQHWGDLDVQDAAGCARALSEQGLADPQHLVIMGGSAGGYTVLNALSRHPGLFKAGVCLYGVANLFTLDMDTHKFEAHYNHSMVGPLPEAAGRYHAWSPVFHVGNIKDALYIFQGSDDKVVPPSQSEEIVATLRSRGIPHKYKLYEGEGHGFRRSETIADYLKETECFLQQNVLFAL